MQQNTNILRGRPWLLLLLLFAWLLPQEAAADWYVQRTYQYQVMLNGANTIRIKAPVYDEDEADHWVCNGNLYVTWTDDSGTEQKLSLINWGFNYKKSGSHNNSHSELPVFFSTKMGGSLDITQGNSSNHFTLRSSDDEIYRTIYENSDGETYDFTAVWRVPYNMLGKKLKFEWGVMIDYTSGSDSELNGLSPTDIEVPKAQDVIVPQLTSPTMSYSKEGMLEIPWFIATDKVTKARYEYTDHLGKNVKVNLDPKATSDVVYLDATVPHNDFHIVVSYKDNLGNDIEEISSAVQDLPVIHAPQGLRVRPLGGQKQKMELKWSVAHHSVKDLSFTDQFVIQRSITGLEDDFQDIGMMVYAEGVTTDSIFTFVDSTLVESIDEGMINAYGALDKLSYRVRRAMTQNWGWDNNSCASRTSIVADRLHLLRIASFTADWEDKNAYTARVSWQYADEPGGVWDDRAQMVLQVVMKNRNGVAVDTVRYVLGATDRQQRYKVVNFFRPCVSFDVKIFVEKEESPFNYLEKLEEFFVPIRNVDDWNDFRSKVEFANGKPVNARLFADITCDTYAGTQNAPYMGVFDGNGHTLTFNVSSFNEDYIAPFRYVSNATIRNLHTAGTISTSKKFAAGLISRVLDGSTVSIENCRSSVTLNSSVNGDATNGGFIAHVRPGCSVTFTNCKFDGSFEGANCANNGGFIGWTDSGGKVTIDNSLFNPGHYDCKIDASATWSRNEVNITLTLKNSYATLELTDQIETIVIDGKTFMVLHNEDDWLKFRDAVKNNSGTNAILAADFTVHHAAAYDNQFTGIFDGNGHTLTADIKGGGTQMIALFEGGRDYTIKNLHLKGKLTGGNHLAGLVGFSVRSGDPACKIDNCRVSAELVCSGGIAGGFVGWGNGADIVNCLFDGSIECTQEKLDGIQYWAGAFYAMVEGTFVNGAVQYCLDNGVFKGTIEHKGLNTKQWSLWGNGENQWTHDNYSKNNLTGAISTQGLSDSQLVEKLGSSNWQVVNGEVVPKMAVTEIIGIVTRPLSDVEPYLTVGWTKQGGVLVPATTQEEYTDYATVDTNPTLPDFYHESNGKIDPELLTTTRQSSVVLAWNTDGNPVDYFTVMRRVKNGNSYGSWQQVATDLTGLSYEDTSVSPLATYEYKVLAINQCEGRDSTETAPAVGECKHTGRVQGYVRFNDGTGAPDVPVTIVHDGITVTTVTTDDAGFFEADELSYYGGTDVTYKISPLKGGKEFQLEVDDYYVTFDARTNDATVHEFIITSGRRFSGYVMYEGTSIPVKGVNFLVNGKKIHNAKGKDVETDYDGSFSFRVMEGDNSIQAVMDKHVFTNDGWYKNAGKQNITSDVAGIYFYDATKVKLTGRIVGGNDQGLKPLDNNLSTNNLGDSLTMVLTLEGDNSSWLVYDNLNPNKSQREEVVRHQRNGNKHFTTVKTQRKRMEVYPDQKTGEYVLMLPPVRWKVQQVYCKGYPTLYQEGQVSEVIDLTNCLTPKDTTYAGKYRDVDTVRLENPTASFHAVYNRIFRNPIQVTYRQIGYDSFDYFGDKAYTATNLAGDRAEVPLAYLDPVDSTTVHYTFGAPVFSLERRYGIQLQVAEYYPYNNDMQGGKLDLVRLAGGTAYMQNGMKADATKVEQKLDSLGQTIFTLQADQVTRMLTQESALRAVTFSVDRDGTRFEAEPLYAYVLNMFPLGSGRDILTEGQPILLDILRDPPGAYSSATLAKGSTINYSYMMNLSMAAGPVLSMTVGQQQETFLGHTMGTVIQTAVNATTTGYNIISDNGDATVQDFVYNMRGSKAYSYTMALSNNVSTSGDPSMVGADADLYIGTVHNISVTPMSTIRALPDSTYKQMSSQLSIGQLSQDGLLTKYAKYGDLVEIAQGFTVNKDGKRDTFHLVRDLSLGYGPKLKSNFFYSQKQLITQIMPAKAKEMLSLMYIGTKEGAQAVADKTQKPVYLSLREPTDKMFAMPNIKTIAGHAYNTTIDKAEEGVNYLVVLPKGKKESDFSDEVEEKYQILYAWAKMIAQNEREKLSASDLVANYDVAGAAGVNYSETYDASFSETTMQYFPFGVQPDYFETDAVSGSWMAAVNIGSTALSVVAAILEALVVKNPTANTSEMNSWIKVDTKTGEQSTNIKFKGFLFRWSLVPVVSMQTVGTNSGAKSYNRTETFTLATGPESHLNVDVFRVKPCETDTTHARVNVDDVFTNYNFYNMDYTVRDKLTTRIGGSQLEVPGPRSFVYRTRGGATANPWEDERRTQFYQPGTLLDERTLKINNPKIYLDKQSVSGVSIDDPACFTIVLSDESEKPEATDELTVLQLFAVDQANPYGAKMTVNGQPLTTGGMTVSVVPGVPTALQLEVRAGQGFDYDGLTIGVMTPTDPVNTKQLVSFDVHFLREAGGVNIATPSDKWVLNTMAQKDDKRGWYIPVTINGFDRHQHNFDHIELQYKESQRGDDAWVNLCSYYASDSLMALANGVRDRIPENGNITTQFYGEGWVMERTYDLRAVVFCRNGNDFLTTSSKVISGIKDTRRPQLFGTPEPKSGLLTQADDIIFNFSEDIEYNYLSAITNFEVKGEVNNNSLSEMVSLQFNGEASVETDVKRNFAGKDLTIDLMIWPEETGTNMPLFSHGSNGQTLRLWLTKDFRLGARVNDDTFISYMTVDKNRFQQVAVTINNTDSLLTFYIGGKPGEKVRKLRKLYTGTGPLIFGRSPERLQGKYQYYKGRMKEARIWYSALDAALLGTTYGQRNLTGFEKDLVDYYPMNEGSGKYAIDRTQGANARLIGAEWAIPRGVSLGLKKDGKGVQLTRDAMNRSAEHDYSLMFWFRTSDTQGTLLSNGRGLKEDIGAENLFHIGFEGSKLMYRSNGFAAEVPGNWNDGGWHNFAMTVNRARNVGNIYVDKVLRTTFEVDSLGGISGGYPLVGATRYDVKKKDGEVETFDADALEGNVDELMFFAQALPQQLINTYTTKSPNGDESGLMTYLSFDRQERQKDNSIELVPYVYSKKLYLDDKGQPRYQLDPMTKEPTNTLVRDYLFADSVDVVLQHFDASHAAPVVPYEEVTNLKFSFIGKGNQLLVDLDEPAAKMNHRNIYVTVRDIEDKNGNTMASPQTACYYVVNSSLEWAMNRLDTTIEYGSNEVLSLPFFNNSASTHTYKIENCPKWLTLDHYSDKLAPLTMGVIDAKVSKDLNVGTYNEILYLTDEEGISEPFYLNLTVEGNQPEWAQGVNGDLLRYSMGISGQVYLYDELDTDTRDIVGVFDHENVCHGFANISHDNQSGENGLFLTVYDSEDSGRDLYFRLWQYNTGREIVLETKDTIRFRQSAMLGTDTPVRFEAGESFVQYFDLKQGWNWVSFNQKAQQLSEMNTLLSSMPWKEGDMITELGGTLTLTYKEGEWLSTDSIQNVVISPKTAYAIKVQVDCAIPVGGKVITSDEDRTIDLKTGWNGIGYTPIVNLPVEMALSDYFDHAESGDVIKSHTEFAYFTKMGNTGQWRGSLRYMKPGEGYMMLHKGEGEVSFTYPYYEAGNYFMNARQNTMRVPVSTCNTMSLSAVVKGVTLEEGDRLVAYANGELVGSEELRVENEAFATAAGEPLFYMSIAGDKEQPIWFAIEREGEIVATTGELMTFKANNVVGSPDVPTAINFVRADYENGKWYTVSGLQLQQKPKRKGLYIYNGRKVVLK